MATRLIIAMGGDDTIEAVIRGMGKSKVLLGMIPAGTANNLAKSLGIPEDPKQACALNRLRSISQARSGAGEGPQGEEIPLL